MYLYIIIATDQQQAMDSKGKQVRRACKPVLDYGVELPI